MRVGNTPSSRPGGIPGESSRPLDETVSRLEEYCRSRQWAGFDPYDALNAPLFARTPLGSSRLVRLALTQFLKRSPVNIRPLLGMRPQKDPKAIALFLTAQVKRARLGNEASVGFARQLAQDLFQLRSPGVTQWCWGYSFPWQTRNRLVPRFAPNLVATTFAANALLDAHEIGLGADCLEAAAGAGEYLTHELFWRDDGQAGFAYPLPDIHVPIHNANFLGAALLCRLAHRTGEKALLAPALEAARYSVGSQRPDGSWAYGAGASQQWVDNFHTGYNLCALRSIAADLGTDEFDPVLSRGFAFYRQHFFTADGIARYFHDRTYPVDIHCVAQGVITLVALSSRDPQNLAVARAVAKWASDHMWDPRGFFYYRVLRTGTIRTPYMRWSQAWMLLALLALLEHEGSDGHGH